MWECLFLYDKQIESFDFAVIAFNLSSICVSYLFNSNVLSPKQTVILHYISVTLFTSFKSTNVTKINNIEHLSRYGIDREIWSILYLFLFYQMKHCQLLLYF